MILAVDQYGERIVLTSEHPRKELIEKCYATKAEKMYVDDKDGNAKHIGYIVRGQWFTFYNLSEWTGKA